MKQLKWLKFDLLTDFKRFIGNCPTWNFSISQRISAGAGICTVQNSDRGEFLIAMDEYSEVLNYVERSVLSRI